MDHSKYSPASTHRARPDGVTMGGMTGTREAQVLPSAQSPQGSSWLFLLPLSAALVAATVSLGRVSGNASTAGGILEGDLRRALLFGPIYAFAGLLLLRRPTQALNLARTQPALWALIAYAALSAVWSSYPGAVMTFAGHMLGYAFIAMAASIAARGSAGIVAKTLWIPGFSLLIATIVLVWGQPRLAIMEIGDQFRWAGPTFHPNILGVVSLLTTWASIVLITKGGSVWRTLIASGSALLAAVCLLGSNSVTSAILSGALWVFLFPMLLIAHSPTGSRRLMWAVALFGMLMGFLWLTLTAPELLTWDKLMAALGRTKNLTGRLALWEAGWKAFLARPLEGWGFDSLASVTTVQRLGVGQLHNGYIDVLVRGGVVAGMLTLAFLWTTARNLWLVRRTRRADATAFAAALVAVLMHNVTEGSLVRSPHPIWLLACVVAFQVSAMRHAVPNVWDSRAQEVPRRHLSPRIQHP